jgi:hypothetical protein
MFRTGPCRGFRYKEDEVMTRTETLALYRPVRASLRRIVSLAMSVCDRADMMRAAKQLGIWVNGTIVFPDDDAVNMLGDVALFEPNQHGRRAFDRFLSEKAPQLDAADFELTQRMGKAFFSLFRCKGRHEVAGIWLEDLLDEGRSLWLMDESAEIFVPAGETFGLRLFDAGAFYVGFGILPPADEETIEFCVKNKARGGRSPFRYSLPVTLYGDSLRAERSPAGISPSLLGGVIGLGTDSHRMAAPSLPFRKAKPRRRN